MNEKWRLLCIEKLHNRELQLSSLLDYIKELEAWRLGGYDGDDVEYILHLLQHPNPDVQSRIGAWGPGTANFTVIGGRGLLNDSGTSTATKARSGTAWKGSNRTTTLGSVNEESPNADLAHALHYASIALLGLLVIEV